MDLTTAIAERARMLILEGLLDDYIKTILLKGVDDSFKENKD